MLLKVSNLTSGYSKKYDVINDVSFIVDYGDIGIVIGENGSGKSTIFKTLLGFIKPKGGTICVDDVDIINMSGRNRSKYVAYVSQNVFMPNLTVFDVISMGRIPYYNFHFNDDEKNYVMDIIRDFNIEDIAFKSASELSGGEKQIVAIARAVAQNAKVLVFDEPTSNLDVVNEMLLESKIKEIAKKRNVCVLISLHNLNLAYDLGDKFIFIKDGNIISEGGKDSFTEENIFKTFNKKCSIVSYEGNTYVKFIKE